jgi:hypothetical protein
MGSDEQRNYLTSAFATQRAARANLRLTPAGGTHMVLRKDKVEIGNSE